MTLSLSCKGCDLVKTSLMGANLANTDLSGADLSHADLTGVNTTGASLVGANTTGTVWSTGVVGSTVTLVNNCSIDVWAGIAGNTAVKSCSSNADCGGGACDLTTAKPTCKQIYCGGNSDCPVNSFCGGVTSYAGSCLGSGSNECGTNRFCDTDNENYFSGSGPSFNNPRSSDSSCSTYDKNARCDLEQKRCFIYQCGWKTCYYVPLPVKDIISPLKACSTNADCSGKNTGHKTSALGPFCYVTSPDKGQCASVNTDGNGFQMTASGSTQTFVVPRTWGGDLAVSESECKEELKLKAKGKYVGCLSPRDACKADSPSSLLKCNQAVSGQGSYLNLYSCDGANSGSCYTDGANSNCCGCPDWLPKTFCVGSNPTWVAVALPYYKIFHSASPTSYSFPYDDKNSTFTCVGKGKEVNVNYTVTFCPK